MRSWAGQRDLDLLVSDLEGELPPALRPLAAIAYNYWWSWAPDGAQLFHDLAPHRWRLTRHNPVRLLDEVRRNHLDKRAADPEIVERVTRLATAFRVYMERGPSEGDPVAFVCAEYGVHRSLPLYSGGLGVLAGDILKEASDVGQPMVGVGLMYSSGYFHQRVDTSGMQHEYWIATDPGLLPAALVTGDDGQPRVIEVPIRERTVKAYVWRVDVGRVPLFLLDTNVPGNSPLCRWVTARLYESSRAIRLNQYALMGQGAIRVLEALDIEPRLVHLNEGHAAMAALELASREVQAGHSFGEALAAVRERFVFTTHTPVPAGNEAFDDGAIFEVFADLMGRLGVPPDDVLALGRWDGGGFGLTPLAIRTSRSTNGVSARHGEVARDMWRNLDEGPILHVTNGVHAPTWVHGPMRSLLDRALGADWVTRAADPETWASVSDIPDAELWAARCEARQELIEWAREKSTIDRLRRGEALDYVEAAAEALDPNVLTLGFARRLAKYKRLHLLAADPGRAIGLLTGDHPVQLLFGGKAHPADDGAKQVLAGLFGLKNAPHIAGRTAFLEDYNLDIAQMLLAGCDVWVNLPTPPLEASGTSGMKAALSGGLNLSVLDGWWAEAYDGSNGWALDGRPVEGDPAERDARDAASLYDTLEQQVVPMFYERDADGVPVRWCQRIKASLMTLGPRFCATRMVRDYQDKVYR